MRFLIEAGCFDLMLAPKRAWHTSCRSSFVFFRDPPGYHSNYRYEQLISCKSEILNVRLLDQLL